MRMTFAQIGEHSEFDKDTKVLKVRKHEIAFVYYRTGY